MRNDLFMRQAIPSVERRKALIHSLDEGLVFPYAAFNKCQKQLARRRAFVLCDPGQMFFLFGGQVYLHTIQARSGANLCQPAFCARHPSAGTRPQGAGVGH